MALLGGVGRKESLEQPYRPYGGGPPVPAREVPRSPGRYFGGELRCGRDGNRLRRRVRGQRQDVYYSAAGPRYAHGDREGHPGLAGLRGLYATPPPFLDGGADEPLHLVLERGVGRGR